MANLFEKLLGTVKEPVAPDESWPKETVDYYEDKSVPVIYEPPEGALLDAWAPTADLVVPGYRGVEEHGVPYDATNNYIIPVAQEDAILPRDEQSVTIETHVPIDPIPVNVVSMPTPRGVEYNVAVSAYTIVAGADPIMISPKSYTRSKATYAVVGTDTCFIGADKQQVRTVGFPITAALGKMEVRSSEEIYAYTPTTNCIVYVMEEFGVSTHEFPV